MDKEQLKTKSMESGRFMIASARRIGGRIMDRTVAYMQSARSRIEATSTREDTGSSRRQKIAIGSVALSALSASAVAARRFMTDHQPAGSTPELQEVLADSSSEGSIGTPPVADTASETLPPAS